MERYISAAAHSSGTAFLGVEMVLAGGTGDDLAVFSYPQTLRVRFVVFHVITALLRGRTIMPEVAKNANI